MVEVQSSGWERVDKGGDVHWYYRARVKFSEAFELRPFPFDWQSLSMVLSSQYACAAPEGVSDVLVQLAPVDLTPAEAAAAFGDGFELVPHKGQDPAMIVFVQSNKLGSAWNYRGWSVQWWLSDPSLSGRGKQYRNLQFSMHFARSSSYYVWNILLPLFLLTSLGFTAFSLDPSTNNSDRLSLLVTLLLTAAAYKIVVSSNLPAVSYLTWLDVYVLMCFSLLVALTVGSAAVASSGPRHAHGANRALAAAAGGAWGLFNAAFAAAGWAASRSSSRLAARMTGQATGTMLGYRVLREAAV